MNTETAALDRVRWAEERLDYRFTDASLLERAFTHRSASQHNNERLEFLGDALLNFTIAKCLYQSRPDDSEGELTRARAALVNGMTLAEIGRELALDTQIILGQGEVRAGGAQRTAALADTLEALIGAVYLDGGHAAAERLIRSLFSRKFESLPRASELKDPKTRLQEWVQRRGMKLPIYAVDSVHGSDHARTFAVTCDVAELTARTIGMGSSRRRAEQDAAAAMLLELTDERKQRPAPGTDE
ncbi:ribonuclease III [Candidatus Rariloculus sp.]|uniref:ribonuclease III n=1 Tax=Candidatus Rariloculus sp. TaxID=3101265 RepID=UPI003D10456D